MKPIALFERLDELEKHMEGREWLVGAGQGQLTEADICSQPYCFDLVYVVHFKCNLRRIIDIQIFRPMLNASLICLEFEIHVIGITSRHIISVTPEHHLRIIPLIFEGAHTK